MAAHRYWALLVTARGGSGNGVSIAEVEMRATSGGADQCNGGTASGTSSSGLVAANAFDNSDSTVWYNGATGGLPVRLSYDFGSAVDVAEVFIRNSPAGATSGLPGSTYGPAACWVQWSDDGTKWLFGQPAADLSGLGNGATAILSSVTDTTPGARLSGIAARLGTAWPTGPVGARVRGAPMRYDSVDGGIYSITSDVAISGTPDVPVARPVYLFTSDNLRLVRSTWSDPVTGAYSFGKLRLQPYVVMARDYTAYYNAVVADRITPVP